MGFFCFCFPTFQYPVLSSLRVQSRGGGSGASLMSSWSDDCSGGSLPVPYLPDGVEITALCGVRPKSCPTNNPPHTCFSPSIFPFSVNDNLVFQQSLIASPCASPIHTQIWPLIFIIINTLIQTTISFLLGSDK